MSRRRSITAAGDCGSARSCWLNHCCCWQGMAVVVRLSGPHGKWGGGERRDVAVGPSERREASFSEESESAEEYQDALDASWRRLGRTQKAAALAKPLWAWGLSRSLNFASSSCARSLRQRPTFPTSSVQHRCLHTARTTKHCPSEPLYKPSSARTPSPLFLVPFLGSPLHRISSSCAVR